MKTLISAFFAAVIVSGSAFASSITLIPPTVSGSSGGVAGWGYNITNSDPSNWMLLNDSFVTGSLATGTFGSYVDYIASQSIVIGPNSSSGAVPWNSGTHSGTGEFDLKAIVPPNTSIPGSINMDYTLFSQDPNDPNFDPGSFVTAGTLNANATVNANFPASTGTPEPGTMLLVSILFAPAAWLRMRHRRRI